ncbi:peptidase domain-containing ABC transporter [Flammeovirga sp. EKP202]|uniref:peptidase domain-containing ABC transporter n=1 Tax=Flammeovirga sp. EKP202 TaxID=2770592 RepID=UPI00165F6CE1|nr:peptidase domain-containing ABC transporter [Flammeovirga sp. EKP202]MBD0402556.1 peptidase domain-containing ABC transporter [Flammeovirga sp. EKP202]
MKPIISYLRKQEYYFQHQLESSDCAAACLTMVLRHMGKSYDLDEIKSFFEFTRQGVSIQDLLDVTKKVGLEGHALKLSVQELDEIPLPVILYWNQSHFVVLEKVSIKNSKKVFHIADPGHGQIKITEDDLKNGWLGNDVKGALIYLEALDNFKDFHPSSKKKNRLSKNLYLQTSLDFIKSKKVKYIFALTFIFLGLLSNFSIPFLFQKTIDEGILQKDIHIVYLLLFVQLILFISYHIFDLLSNILLTKLNFSLSVKMKNFLLHKLIKLPISYYDTRINAELLQRLTDQEKIQTFLTWKGIDLTFSVLNVIVFGVILLYFNIEVFAVYALLSALSIIWVVFFLNKRKTLQYAKFLRESENNNSIYEFIMNMSEIKINNAESKLISKLLSIQQKINDISLKSLYLNLYQNIGADFITKLKELIAIGICAVLIINDELTIGTLLSISYVIGQLNTPLKNITYFILDAQDATIANEKVSEIYNKVDESENTKLCIGDKKIQNVIFQKVSFKYPGKFNPYVLKDINLCFPENSITAIVGASGSGKTTLLKLLLSYYPPSEGNVILNDKDLLEIVPNEWRKKCGTVLQGGKIFSGTILDNISLSDSNIDDKSLLKSTQIACIHDFIMTLPMGYHTKIGESGMQLSGGQQQRLLIARAVYKDPEFIILDEATSALDAENEKKIHDNLQSFFKGKTVVIIAHRLSTVKNSDNIIVLKKGEIIEQGNHSTLVANKSEYYELIKNQLELGM